MLVLAVFFTGGDELINADTPTNRRDNQTMGPAGRLRAPGWYKDKQSNKDALPQNTKLALFTEAASFRQHSSCVLLQIPFTKFAIQSVPMAY